MVLKSNTQFESYWIPLKDREAFYEICKEQKLDFKEIGKGQRADMFGHVFCFKMQDCHYYTLASVMKYPGYELEIG